MADIVTLGDVSSSDKGSGTKLKTGGRRQHNMPKECVKRKMKTGMSRDAAVKACYPDQRFEKGRKDDSGLKRGLKIQREYRKDIKRSVRMKRKRKGY